LRRRGLVRPVQRWLRAGEAAATALEGKQGLDDFGHGGRLLPAVEHDEVGRVTGLDAVRFDVHQPGRTAGHHVQARAER